MTKKALTASDFKPTGNGRGLDVSSRYLDDLDQSCCDYIAKLSGEPVKVVDLGGGLGAQSFRMAALGADVLLIDISAAAQKAFIDTVGRVSLLQKNFMDLQVTDIPQSYDVLYSQRALHYLPYADAKKCLSLMFNAMAPGGAAFISVAGLGSEFGPTYPDRDLPVELRFNTLSQEMQDKYDTRERLVLYSEGDMRDLLGAVGFSNITFVHSNFGQVRAIAFKP